MEYALENGLYDIREKALNALGALKSKSSLPVITKALDDNIKNVSYAAMHAIQQIGSTKYLDDRIRCKKEFWKTKEAQRQEKSRWYKARKKAAAAPRWDRPSRQTLENVKQMLNKPMNTGKWL